MAPKRIGMVLAPIITLLLMFSKSAESQTGCDIPAHNHGDWYSQEDGYDVLTTINIRRWIRSTRSKEQTYVCMDRHDHLNPLDQTGYSNTTYLMKHESDGGGNCFYCVDVLWRTRNILQYKLSDCLSGSSSLTIDNCPGKYELPGIDQVASMFRMNPENTNCIDTFDGWFQFSYEVNVGGGGICNNPDSQIQACQDPGSPYVDNQVFLMRYGRCRDVSTSQNRQIRYQCMGTWFAVRHGTGYTYAAVADTVEKDNREKFKCLMTNRNQKDPNNQIRWVVSRFPDCRSLNSIYDGPLKLVLTRTAPPTPYMTPKCNLPRNITGTWFTQGVQYKSDVKVNETHIHFKTVINEFEYQETIYSCQQAMGTRFLMTKVIVGKCEVDFVCWDLMPRHHSIVRFRIGRPNRLTQDELADPNYLEKKFREACSWLAFTFNRDDTNWKYEYLVLNPPAPVPCPVGGRYSFVQKYARPNEKYMTRIRGVTDKPRVQVDCRITTSEFKSCSNDMTKIEVDAEYCETVDYRGSPVGEYDESDHTLRCIGYWFEDMKSYLITYDDEDAISAFRCWVYERMSWTSAVMSRSQTARCPRDMKAQSFMLEGTGLSLQLQENERLFDDCPMRFDPGRDPYAKPTTIYVLNTGTSPLSGLFTLTALLSIVYSLLHL